MRGHVASGGRGAVVDTGFTGHLTLLPGMIRSLALPRPGFVEVELADGNTAALGVYDARLFWHGLSHPGL